MAIGDRGAGRARYLVQAFRLAHRTAQGQSASALAPYVEHLVTSFGPRLMWGSDWPVLKLSGDTYGDWVATAKRLTGLDGVAQSRLFAGAAAEFYGLSQAGQSRKMGEETWR